MDPLRDVLEPYVDRGEVGGLVWLAARDGEVQAGAAGVAQRDTIFRISSMTKPITAAAAMVLVEEGRLALDDPVDDLLPELADRRVLARPEGPLDDTVPAHRPITLRDVLTFRLGLGMDFDFSRPQPVLDAMGELGIGAGPPEPQTPPPPDEFMRRLGTLPLVHQPGERWLYHTGSDVLGVLLARAAGQPFEEFLQERLFAPLGMVDTGFFVPAGSLDRFGPCRGAEGTVYDPVDGQWSRSPAFPSGGAGLVSTADDFLAFASMLLAGGGSVLSAESVATMTTNRLGPGQRGPDDQGWGFGVAVQPAGDYGWAGGLGTTWGNDPARGQVGILLTDQMWTSPVPPPVSDAFWAALA